MENQPVLQEIKKDFKRTKLVTRRGCSSRSSNSKLRIIHMSSFARSRKGRKNPALNRPKIRRSLRFLKMIKTLMMSKSTQIIIKRMRSLKIG